MNSTSDKNDEWPLTARMVEDFRTMHMEEAEEVRHRYPEGVADEVKRRVNMICDAALTTLRPPKDAPSGNDWHEAMAEVSNLRRDLEAMQTAMIEAKILGVSQAAMDRLNAALNKTRAQPSATDALDARRLDWLDLPGHWIESHEDDAVKSWHEPRKQAHFYINGKYTKAEGATARAAIDAAMAALDGGAKNG